jgi:hypothetical protein
VTDPARQPRSFQALPWLPANPVASTHDRGHGAVLLSARSLSVALQHACIRKRPSPRWRPEERDAIESTSKAAITRQASGRRLLSRCCARVACSSSQSGRLGLWIRRQCPRMAPGQRRTRWLAQMVTTTTNSAGRAARHALAQQQIAVEPRCFVIAHLPSPACPPLLGMPASNMWLKRLKPTQHTEARRPSLSERGRTRQPRVRCSPPDTKHQTPLPPRQAAQHDPAIPPHLPHPTCLTCLACRPWFLSAQRAKVCKSISSLSTESRKQMPLHCCG